MDLLAVITKAYHWRYEVIRPHGGSSKSNFKEQSMYSEKYAKVIVKNNSKYTDNLFTYKIPEFLVNDLQIGHRILVPFGKSTAIKKSPVSVEGINATPRLLIKTNENKIFGTSYYGIQLYAKENLPDTYIINNRRSAAIPRLYAGLLLYCYACGASLLAAPVRLASD